MPEIKLQLAGGREAWDPGALLEGTIHLESEHEWAADYVEVIVWWDTSGKGERDKGVMYRETFVQRGERVATRVERPFRVKLPMAPWTYHGRLIKIDWHVGLYARERGRDEQAVMVPIRMYPGGGKEPAAPGCDFLPDDAPPEE